MGLDTTHGCWNSSYGSFHRFRVAIAQMVDIDLENMQGFGGRKKFPNTKVEPLVILLDHSDCEGDITPSQALALGVRLTEVIADIDTLYTKVKVFREYQYDKEVLMEKIETFAEGLFEAYNKNETVEFH